LVKDGSIEPNPRKIQALAGLSQPKNVSQLRQFIGLASYFRKFVPQFSEQMKPLYQLTSKMSSFVWKAEHEEIRQKIISVLTHDPVLIIFDPQYPIELHTDASASGTVIFTDCNSLKASRAKVELPPRVHRWWAYLQSFDFTVEYRKGNRMAHVDFLSRNPIVTECETTNRVPEVRIDLTEVTNNKQQTTGV